MAMEFKRRLPIPMEIREEMPLSAELTAKKQAFDAEVAKVFTGEEHSFKSVPNECPAATGPPMSWQSQRKPA